ncbi:MAG: hypothetical protein LKK00_01530 [Intestinimonas sp.]|jgi:hypothetical protein|nr:hypothetical protein [Intestinimonas sp.]
MEWTVVTVIIALVGLVGVFCGCAWKLARELQNNTDATRHQTETMNRFRQENQDDHRGFSDKLDNHEHRITFLEAQK